jgi:hypothetical protein
MWQNRIDKTDLGILYRGSEPGAEVLGGLGALPAAQILKLLAL